MRVQQNRVRIRGCIVLQIMLMLGQNKNKSIKTKIFITFFHFYLSDMIQRDDIPLFLISISITSSYPIWSNSMTFR